MGQGSAEEFHPGARSPASRGKAVPDKNPVFLISFSPRELTELLSLLFAASFLLGPPQPFTEKV